MKPNVKQAITAIGGVFLMALTASFLLADLVQKERNNERRLHSAQMRKSVRHIVEIQSEKWADRLSNSIEKNILDNSGQNIGSTDFLALATRKPDGTLDWFKSKNSSMTKEWLHQEVNQAPIESIQGDNIIWMRMESPDRQVYFAILLSAQFKSGDQSENKITVGILPSSIFSELNLITKGDQENLFVVNNLGFTFSYPDAQYVGSKFETHPLVLSLLKNQSNESTQEYTDAFNVKMIGGYDLVAHTNLYVMMSQPESQTFKTLLSFTIQMAIVSLAIMILVALIVLYLGAKTSEQISVLEKNLAKVHAPQLNEVLPPVQRTDHSIDDFARALTQYMKNSLTALLGYMQMTDSKDALERMNAEARRVRDFIEALSAKVTPKAMKSEAIDITPLMNQLMSVYKQRIIEQNIQIDENILSEMVVRGDYDSLKESFKTLIEYVLSRIDERATNKKLIIQSLQVAGQFQFSIEAQGVNISDQERKNVFLPFKVSIPQSRLLDLDLAQAHNQILSQRGELAIEKLSSSSVKIVCRMPLVTPTTTEKTEFTELISQTPKENSEPTQTKPQKNYRESPRASIHQSYDEHKIIDKTLAEFKIESHTTMGLNFPPTPLGLNASAMPEKNASITGVQIRKPKVRTET